MTTLCRRIVLGILGIITLSGPALLAAEAPGHPTSSSSSPTTWATATWAATARRRSRRRTSIALAAEGMRFTQHYSGSPVCAPSRCVLMTGKHTGPRHRPHQPRHAAGRAVSRCRPAPSRSPGSLKARGYATGAFGKWGLGGPGSTGMPDKQGIDRFFGYLCQGKAHNFYPTVPLGQRPQGRAEEPGHEAARQAARRRRSRRTRPATRRYRGHGVLRRPDLRAGAPLRPRQQGQPVLPVRAHDGSAPGPAGAGGFAGRVSRQVGRSALRRRQGLPAAPFAARRLRRHGHAHGPRRSAGSSTWSRSWASTSRPSSSSRPTTARSTTATPAPTRSSSTRRPACAATRARSTKAASACPASCAGRAASPPGSVSERVTGFEDWLPTLLELIGNAKRSRATSTASASPRRCWASSRSRGHSSTASSPATAASRRCASATGRASARTWCRAARPSPTCTPSSTTCATIRARRKDVSAQHPDVVATIERIFREQHVPSAVFPIPALDGK